MANEPIQGLPYPELTGVPPNVPEHIKALADAVAPRTVMRFASLAARDAALPAPVDGMVCYVAADNGYYVRVGGAWLLAFNDTAETELTRAAGLSGKIAARRVGQLVEVTFDVTGTIPSGNVAISVNGAVPVGMRPTANRRGPAFVGGLSTGGAYVTPSGLIGVRNDTGASRTAADGSVLYILAPPA